MAAIVRRSIIDPISIPVTLATADDLDGTTDNTQAFDVTGARRVLVWQIDSGTDGTAGIDCVEVSHDGGVNWAPDATVMLASANDHTGTIVVDGVLNVAGTEPATVAGGMFKAGPYEGPTAIRIGRKTTDTGGTTWVTGAPAVLLITVGLTAGSPTALAT